jgi:parallel beta-helix repeat protein
MLSRKALSLALFLPFPLAVLTALFLARGDFPAQAQGPTTRYVAPGGNCGGAAPCYSAVQAAVDAARPRDEIRVAAGTYTGVNNYGSLRQVVYINKSVTIRGGYTITRWDTPNPTANPTTLDAQRQGRVLYITGDISSTIEGLRITGGNAAGLGGYTAGSGSPHDVGGGVYVVTATATINHSQVYNNTAEDGGGLYLRRSRVTLNGNTFSSNSASNDGGGLYLADGDATLSGNTVSANTATWAGGGLYLDHSAATLSGNTVSFNTAYGGGGLYLWYSSDVMFSGNTVSSNTARLRGGGLFLASSAVTLSGNSIAFNTAISDGGGLFLDGSRVTLSGNTISSNTAGEYGGGLYLWSSDATVSNDLVADNRASSMGSGLYVESSFPRLLHTTIARNTGGDGSGVYVTGSAWWFSSVALTNTILVGHSVGVIVTASQTVTLEATLWGAGTWANATDWRGAGTIVTGTRNYWGNPAFVDPGAGNYHIGPNSAAINAGIAAGVYTDIDREPRPYQGGYDLGADEYWPPGAPRRIYLPPVLRHAP